MVGPDLSMFFRSLSVPAVGALVEDARLMVQNTVALLPSLFAHDTVLRAIDENAKVVSHFAFALAPQLQSGSFVHNAVSVDACIIVRSTFVVLSAPCLNVAVEE